MKIDAKLLSESAHRATLFFAIVTMVTWTKKNVITSLELEAGITNTGGVDELFERCE